MEKKPNERLGLPTVLVVLGAVAIVCGIGMVFLPAALVAGGLLSITGGVLLIKGEGGGHE